MKVSPYISKLVPYKPGKPISETQREYGLASVVKLASNENPLGPSPKVLAALKAASAEVHRYPDATSYETLQALCPYYSLEAAWLSLGNGSNEVIDLLIRLFCESGDQIFTSQAAFIAYKICAQAARVDVCEVPLTPDLKFDLQELSRQLQQAPSHRNRLVFIANPNNPTGTYVNQSELLEFLKKTQDMENLLVILDEAYWEFVRAKDFPNGIEMLKRFPHVAVIRTLSKVFGIAGLRLGVLLARPEIIDLYNRIRNPFNVNSLAQVAAIAAVNDKEYIQRARQTNSEGLDFFYRELKRLGLKYWPSQANFVLFDVARDSQVVFEGLLQQGLIMRPVKNYGLNNHLRLSVGLPEENKRAIEALEMVLKEITAEEPL